MCASQSGIRPDQQATSSCQVEHRLHPIGTMAALPQTSGCCCPADAVICPVCCKANLAELQGIIACPRGDVRLDLRTEQLNLQDLRHRLASVLEVSRLPFSWGCTFVIYPLASLLNSGGWCRGCHTASFREKFIVSGLQAHNASCPGRVEFTQNANFGPPALWASCGRCHLLQMIA